MERKVAEHRNLRFESLDQVSQELDTLLSNEYTSVGNWNLSETCGHIQQWMSFPVDCFPRAPWAIRVMLWLMKVTIGKSQLKQVLANGFKPGMPTMPETVPNSDATSEADAVRLLQKTIGRFQAPDGPIRASPFFGPMDRATALQLQLRHCEHHLGFLIPEKS